VVLCSDSPVTGGRFPRQPRLRIRRRLPGRLARVHERGGHFPGEFSRRVCLGVKEAGPVRHHREPDGYLEALSLLAAAPPTTSPGRNLELELNCRTQPNHGAVLQRDGSPFGDRLAIDRRAEGTLVILGGELPSGEPDCQMLAGDSD